MQPNHQTIQSVKSAMLCIQRFQWEQGCAAQAILEYEGLTDEVIRLCEAAVLRGASDGRIGIMEKNESVNDPAAIGEALIACANQNKGKHYRKAADKLYEYLKYKAPRTKDGIFYHFDGDWGMKQVWVDAYYMVPPFLCKYGDIEEAMKQIKGFRKYLYHEDKKLLSHIWDDKNKEFGRVDFWGVGNGWAIAGIHRVIIVLDEFLQHFEDTNQTANEGKENVQELSLRTKYSKYKDYLINYARELIDGCIRYQREDGLFHNVLDKPETFVETNFGQMLAYTIYRGVKSGYLDRSYLSYADKARAAAYAMVDEYGFVRGVCGMPNFDKSGVATEGQAFFILMEAAARDLFEQ
jgi:unsaturated rhamnogalacturonyl hydrolase